MSKALRRIKHIDKKIGFIQEIVEQSGGITEALKDEKSARAAILMHLTSIAEQFDKLAKESEFEILSHFDKRDLKGTYDIRTFIAHDYEGVNLAIIESVIRNRLPHLKQTTQTLLSQP